MNKWWTVAVAVICFGVGWLTQGWRLNEKIADLQATRSNEISEQSNAALKDLKDASGLIKAAATDAKTDNTNLAVQLSAIRRDMKNAKPLPIDCKPDDIRVRNLSASIDAINKAIARPIPSK